MDKESRKRQILECACSLFAQQGYESTSLAQIAKECACSPSLLIRHFGSKENIYRELLAEYEETCKKTIISEIPQGSPMAQLEQLYRALAFDVPSEVYVHSKLYTALQSRRGSNAELAQAEQLRQDVGMDIFLPVLNRCVSEGILPQDYPCETTARVLWMYIIGARFAGRNYPDHSPMPFSVVKELIIEL